MADDKIVHFSVAPDPTPPRPVRRSRRRGRAAAAAPVAASSGLSPTREAPSASSSPASSPRLPWHEFLRSADNRGVSQRFSEEASVYSSTLGADYCFLALLDSETLMSD